MATPEAKQATRREVGRRITALPRAERTVRSQAACRHLVQAPELAEARTVLLYAPLPDELDVWPAVRALAATGKRLFLPKCQPEERGLLCVEVADFRRDLARGAFNILEPRSDQGVGPAELDVVVAPGRAFDGAGRRVGRGAGYYDRLFGRPDFRAFICGAAFDCQIFEQVPAGPHDVPVDAIVTESGLVRTARSRPARTDE